MLCWRRLIRLKQSNGAGEEASIPEGGNTRACGGDGAEGWQKGREPVWTLQWALLSPDGKRGSSGWFAFIFSKESGIQRSAESEKGEEAWAVLEKRKYEAIFLESWGANLPGRYSECLEWCTCASAIDCGLF